MPRRIVPLDVTFYERAFTGVEETVANSNFLVRSYSKHVYGGCKEATIEGFGTRDAIYDMVDLLRCPVVISGEGTDAWWGFVNEVEIHEGGAVDGKSLDTMFNSVKVAYTTPGTGANPSGERKTTAAVTDATSISTYGTKELLATMTEATDARAEQERDRLLDQRKDPLPVLSDMNAPTYPYHAIIRCRGWWYTLDWRLYALDEGVIAYESTDEYDHLWAVALEQLAKTSTEISFRDDPSADIVETGGSWSFQSRQVVETSGAAIADNNSATASQGGMWPITSARSSQFTVYDPSYDFDDEDPGNSITITPYGSKVAQSFQHAYTDPVYLSRVRLYARRVGTPAGATPQIRVSLQADSAGSPSGTIIESATYSGADVGESFSLIEFVFGNTNALAASTTYWIVVESLATASHDDFFLVQINDKAGYADGACQVYHDGAWEAWSVTHAAAADMLFVVEGSRETTKQIFDIIGSHGQFLSTVTITNASGVFTCPRRPDGDSSALTEVEALLDTGTTNDRRVLATVEVNRTVELYEEPAVGTDDHLWDTNGALYDASNVEILPYLCPVGFWMKRRTVATPGRAFVESATYDAHTGIYTPEARGLPSPWSIIS